MQSSFVADCALQQALEKRSVSVPCLNGHVLFKQGGAPPGLYILKSGKASLVMKAENGTELLHRTRRLHIERHGLSRFGSRLHCREGL